MNKSLVPKVAKNTVKSRESKGPPFICKPEIVLFKVLNAVFFHHNSCLQNFATCLRRLDFWEL